MKRVYEKHIGAYGVLIHNDKIALIKKARGGYLGKLDLPGGGIKHYETPEKALIREVKEEAGVDVLRFELIDATSCTFTWQMKKDTLENLHHFGIIYKIKVKGRLKRTPDGLDSLGVKWYKITKIHKNEVTPFVIHSLEKLGYKLL